MKSPHVHHFECLLPPMGALASLGAALRKA